MKDIIFWVEVEYKFKARSFFEVMQDQTLSREQKLQEIEETNKKMCKENDEEYEIWNKSYRYKLKWWIVE